MAKVVAEVRYKIDVDDGELRLYRESGLWDLLKAKGMFEQYEEIMYEEVVEE